MKKILPIIIVVVAIAGVTIYAQSQKTKDGGNTAPHTETRMTDNTMMSDEDIMVKDDAMEKNDTLMTNDDSMMKQDKSMMEDDAALPDDTTAMHDDEVMMEKQTGSFVDYADITIADLDGKIVLDFSAPWCPSCRNFEKNVKDNLDKIPKDLTIVKIDYDSNKEMRTKYGVRVQHTFVQIDSDGNKIGLWTGGSTIDSVVSKLK